ncbi:AbiTii domain-containing protein [Streptomyces sp. NPDC001178]
MRRTIKRTPLDRLEEDVLDESVATQRLLKTVVVLGGRAFSQPLRQWALNELRGYNGPREEIPQYRTIAAPIQADSRSPFWQARNQTISVFDLPKFAQDDVDEVFPMRSSVAQIQGLIASHGEEKVVKIPLPAAAELARVMSIERREERVVVESVHWAVHVTTLQDVLEQVRNRLIEFIADLRSQMPPGAEAPTVMQVHRTVQNIYVTSGNNSPVHVNAPVTPERADVPVEVPIIKRRWF